MSNLQFLNTAFVAAAALALVPVIIHLVQRRKVQRVVFGSVMFLRKMSQRVIRRRRLTELLLILLRAAALAILALAFARPLLWRPVQQSGASTALGEEAAVILIDNSYSVQAGGRFQKAKDKALDILKKSAPTARIGVASFSNQYTDLAAIGSSFEDCRRVIEQLKPSFRATDLTNALEKAESRLRQRGEQGRRIILISDFQKSGWRSKGFHLAPNVALSTHELADQDIANVYLERLAAPRLVVAGGFPEVISAVVVNASLTDLTNAEVSLNIEDKLVEKMGLTVRAGSEMPVRFRHAFTEARDVPGAISIKTDDAAQADNTIHFSIHVTPRVRVLLVNGDMNARLEHNDGFFIRMALVPDPQDKSSPFELKEVAPGDLKPTDLAGQDAVLVINADTVPPEAAAALKEFIYNGGGVAFICGDKVRPDEFNKVMGELAPCKLWKLALKQGEEVASISLVDYKHEIFRPFAEPHSGELGSAVFGQFLAVKDSQLANVLARFNNGQPFLLERSFGKGRSLLLTSGTDLTWNDLFLQGNVFVPFVHELTRRLCAQQASDARNLAVGESVNKRVPAGQAVEFKPPGQPARKLEPKAVGEERVASFDLDAPGVYELKVGTEVSRYTANIENREGDLRREQASLIAQSVTPPTANIETPSGNVAIVPKSTARAQMESQQKIWRYLALALLAVLVGEMILAGRSGAA